MGKHILIQNLHERLCEKVISLWAKKAIEEIKLIVGQWFYGEREKPLLKDIF